MKAFHGISISLFYRILENTESKTNITKLKFKANSDWRVLDKYLPIFTEAGYIEKTGKEYQITQQGRNLRRLLSDFIIVTYGKEQNTNDNV